METLVKESVEMIDKDFYRGKKVFVTGHTGFKGSWMTMVLLELGAKVTGYSLEDPTDPSLFRLLQLEDKIQSVTGDIRNLDLLQKTMNEVKPEIVIHLAAQPIVRESYKNPVETYSTNVMGTVHILEAVRNCSSVKSFLNVTTDKVYLNKEWAWGYRENEELNGFDPYSNSKSCSELVTSSYKNAFFQDGHVAISTARAGNVIGGGDFAVDRIIPDCVRAIEKKEKIVIRNPYSIRPYQHVLEPVMAYLMIAQEQYENVGISGSFNVGPNETDCIATGNLVSMFCDQWNKISSNHLEAEIRGDHGPHEAQFLKLDCSKLKTTFGWNPKWDTQMALKKTAEWTKVYMDQRDVADCMRNQIQEYLKQE